MGCDVLDHLGGDVQRSAHRVLFKRCGLAIPLASIAANLQRVTGPALQVLATCAGCNLAYATVRNLGFDVSKWVSVENDPKCRAVTRRVVPAAHLDDSVHDVCNVPPWLQNSYFDLHINTSPCQPFSRLQSHPRGFRDPRAEPMR